MSAALVIGLTNVWVWVWAVYVLLRRREAEPFKRLLIVSITVDLLKRGLQVPRPAGARACDAFAVGGPSRSFGMPSGHVATAVAGWYMITGGNTAVALAAGAAMTYARVAAGCHTLPQCIVGGLIGWRIAAA